MPQLLIEIFSEEIPARMQQGAARDLERMAGERLKAAGLEFESLTTFAGPRRLTLVVEGLPHGTPDREEELKGPRTSAPEQALEGFLRKSGLTKDQLVERDGVWIAVISSKGRPTEAILWDVISPIILSFPWPKSMKWGPAFEWIRPVRRIVCLFDGKIVPGTIGACEGHSGVHFSDMTEGHRFLGSGEPFAVTSAADYFEKLKDEFVIVGFTERRVRILEAARRVCADRGLALVDDDGLLDEVAGLAEWPTPILGDMDPQFLTLPPEVVRLSMKVHQKYFAVRDPATGGLAPHFVVVANVEASDGGKALAAGNSRVLSARLNDARFFWDEDLKTGFDAWNEKLSGVTFHAKLGTLAQRVDRIAALAREIAPLVGADPDEAFEAARLAKADLASGMVGEFPELQGVMGGYYARRLPSPLGGEGGSRSETDEGAGSARSSADDESVAGSPLIRQPSADTFSPEGRRDRLADAVRDHYKPQGPADTVPTAPLTVAVALADKLDTLVGFFAIDEKPTGSKDPFALRRAALGVIRLVLENGIRIDLMGVLARPSARLARQRHRAEAEFERDSDKMAEKVLRQRLFEAFKDQIISANQLDQLIGGEAEKSWANAFELLSYVSRRLEVKLRDQGKRHDLVDAVFALGDDDLVRIVRRVEALDAFLSTDDGANLLAGYKRASSLLEKEEKKGWKPGMVETGLANQPEAETALAFAAAAAATAVDTALDTEDFAAAMTALAALRAPVDAFLTGVMVNSDVPTERENRLKLLGQVRAVMGRVADFGVIAG